MRPLFRAGIAAALLASVAGCSGFTAYRYKQYYAMIQPIVSYDKSYEDSRVSFQFDITEKKIWVDIANLSGEPVSIDWPNVYLVDAEGISRHIVNDQVIFTKDISRMKPTTIAPGATERNLIVPVDSVEELEQWTWYIKPFYTQTDDTAPLNLKKVFRVVIPVQAGNERRRYSFQFMVTDVIPYRALSLG